MPTRPPAHSVVPPLRSDRPGPAPSRRAAPIRRLGRRNRWVSAARRATLVAVVGYVAFHVLRGDLTLHALTEQSRKTRAAEDRVAELQERHDRLQDRVSRLSHPALDRDLLEERVRIVLGWAHADEYVLVIDPGDAGD